MYASYSHSEALLPTGTRINPRDPDANEYFEETDTLLVVRSSRSGGLTVAKSSGGMNAVVVGDHFEAHHDQAGYSFGMLTVVGIVRSRRWSEDKRYEGDVPNKKLSLRVYK